MRDDFPISHYNCPLSRTNVTTKNGRYYLKQNLLDKDVSVAIIFKVIITRVTLFIQNLLCNSLLRNQNTFLLQKDLLQGMGIVSDQEIVQMVGTEDKIMAMYSASLE